MADNLTSDEELVKETVEKIKKQGSREEKYLKALKEFNEAYLTSVSKKTKSAKGAKALLTKLKEFSSEDYSKNYEDLKDSAEKSKESFEKDTKLVKDVMRSDFYNVNPNTTINDAVEIMRELNVKSLAVTDNEDRCEGMVYFEDLSSDSIHENDKSSLKLLLKDLLNESSNRINHLEKLKEKKLALLKSI